MDNKESSKSWFCVLNNPQDVYNGEPNEIAEKVLEEWVQDHPTRTGAVAYCISSDGLKHLHMVLEDTNKARFSALKKTYPKAHLQPTKGTKEQAEDYINKRGKFEEKGEQVLYVARFGEIKGHQGARKDFEVIEELIEQGKTPKEIMSISFGYRRYERMIKQAYYDKRVKETPYQRQISVKYHVGESGSGKSYIAKQIVDEQGEDAIYRYTDYENGGLDNYNGEPVLFMDEFRGQMRYAQLLGMLDVYKSQFHARYGNITGLWTEVHIASVVPPEKLYQAMVSENKNYDSLEQFKRRIDCMVYHWIDEDGKYRTYEQPMEYYTDYETLRYQAENQITDTELFDLFAEEENTEQLKF